MAVLSVGVVGALGRMGQTVAQCVREADDLTIGALVVEPDDPHVGEPCGRAGEPAFTDDLRAASRAVDVLVDFTLASALGSVLEAAGATRTPLVSGVTGVSTEQRVELDRLGATVPVFWAPNMSVGVQVMVELLQRAVVALGEGYDIAITETHHRFKRDAPSGTAKRLAEAVASAHRPPIDPAAIPVTAVRGGDVVGDHSVFFMGLGDRLEITHRSTSRRAFAMGALRAARWLVGRSPGRYDMSDLLAGSAGTSGNEKG